MRRGSGKSRRGRVRGRSLLVSSALLVIIVFVALSTVAGSPRRLAGILAQTDPGLIAKAAALILLAEAFRAVRLALIVRHMGRRIGFLTALAARLLGRLAGLITPASLASTPVRAAIVGAYSGLHIGSALGAAVLETMADALVASVIALASALPLLPGSLPVLLFSLLASAIWVAGVAAASNDSLAYGTYRRLDLPARITCKVEMQRRLLVDVIRQLRHARLTASVSVLTVAAYVAEALSVLEAWGVADTVHILPAALGSVAAAYVASIFPTPGGSGAVELSLKVYLDPHSLITWRVAQLAVSVIPAGLILAVIPNLRDYFTEEASLEGEGCGDAGASDIRYARAPA